MPWKNGQGLTKEIFIEDSPHAGLVFRLSIATISKSGPFSQFPKKKRIITCLGGSPVSLKLGTNQQITLKKFEPFEFDGHETVYGSLNGELPAEDFNVMFDPNEGDASITVVHLACGEQTTVTSASVHTPVYIFVAFGAVKSGLFTLNQFDTFIHTTQNTITLTCDAPTTLFLVHYRRYKRT